MNMISKIRDLETKWNTITYEVMKMMYEDFFAERMA